MTDTAIQERDEAIAEALVSGRSVRSVRKEFGLSADDLDAALERLWPVDTAARIRMIKRDVGRLDRLIEKFYEKALDGCVQSGLCTVRLYERLHGLVGLDAVQRIDLQIVRPPEAKSSHERIRAAIMELIEQAPPAQRALRKRLEQLSPEKALEMLGPLESNGGDGAVDALSGLSDREQSH